MFGILQRCHNSPPSFFVISLHAISGCLAFFSGVTHLPLAISRSLLTRSVTPKSQHNIVEGSVYCVSGLRPGLWGSSGNEDQLQLQSYRSTSWRLVPEAIYEKHFSFPFTCRAPTRLSELDEQYVNSQVYKYFWSRAVFKSTCPFFGSLQNFSTVQVRGALPHNHFKLVSSALWSLMKEQYEYLSLKEAVLRKGEEVNFYGAVSEYEHPKSTRGTDVICTMSVVDISYDNPGLRLIIFANPSAMNVPLVKSIGDIIRVHRVEMGDYNGAPQAIAKVSRKSSFVLFQGKNGKGYEPYQKAHTGFSFEQHDERRVDAMRNWIVSHPLCTRKSDYLVFISGIKEGSYFDLCCKILYVDERTSEYATIIYVWDGTDAMPRIISILPETGIDEFPFETSSTNGYPYALLPRDVLSGLPPVGTMLPIVPEIQLDDLPGQLQLGDWVKFRNLACRSRSGMLEAVFTRESKISLLSKDTQLVKNCESLYEERVLSEEGRLPQSCPMRPQSLTVTDYDHVGYSTLREVLAYPEVTYKFRCLVRVTSTWPSEVVDFCSPLTYKEQNGTTTETPNPHFVYGVRLTLEDPTARLQAYLYGEDGDKFFNGHPPSDLRVYSPIVGALERKAHKLLGMRLSEESGLPSFRDPPWIKCCIKSYYTDKCNPWGSRCFRIFGTTYPG